MPAPLPPFLMYTKGATRRRRVSDPVEAAATTEPPAPPTSQPSDATQDAMRQAARGYLEQPDAPAMEATNPDAATRPRVVTPSVRETDVPVTDALKPDAPAAARRPWQKLMPQMVENLSARPSYDPDDQQTRARVARPVDFVTKRVQNDAIEPKPHDDNGRLKSTLIGLGRGALNGLARGGVGGAIAGAAFGGVSHAADPSLDEQRAQAQHHARDRAAAAEVLGAEDARSKTRLGAANADYAESVKPAVALGGLEIKRDAAAAKRVRDEQNSVLSILRLRKGQMINPADADDSALLERARRAGVTVDPEVWNSSASNLVPVEVVDPENPTQKRKQFYNKATGEISDVGQSGYVAPVHSDTELTSNQEGVNADRDASRELAKQRVGIAAGNAQLQHEKFMWEVSNGIPAAAKRSFDLQTGPLQKELTSKLSEIKSWQQRAESNAVMPDVAEKHITEIQARVSELQTQIGAARDKALSSQGHAAPHGSPAPQPQIKGRVSRAKFRAQNPQYAGASDAEVDAVLAGQGLRGY